MFVIKKWMIYIFLVVVMTITSPDLESHEAKIQNIFKYSGSNTNIVQVSLNQSPSLTYHDIYIFTYTKHNRRVLTFGAFGMVFDVGS